MVYTPPLSAAVTSGTPVKLSSVLPAVSATTQPQNTNTKADWVTFVNLSGNSGTFYIGGLNPNAGTSPPTAGVAAATKTGIPVTAGNTYTFPAVSGSTTYDLTLLWADTTNTGDKFSITYARR